MKSFIVVSRVLFENKSQQHLQTYRDTTLVGKTLPTLAGEFAKYCPLELRRDVSADAAETFR